MQLIEVTGFAVRSAVIRLRAEGKALRFVLYPMVHVAEPGFYAAVASRLRTAQVVVAEGVGGGGRRSSLVGALALSYRVVRWRRRSALVVQDIDYGVLDAQVINPDVSAAEFDAAWHRIPLRDRLLVWLALPAITIARLLGGTRAIWSASLEQNDLPSTQDEAMADSAPELDEALLGERDRRLLDTLARLCEERGQEDIDVAVVYGAAHLPAVVHGLHARYGYRARTGDWLTVATLVGIPATPAERTQRVGPPSTVDVPRPRRTAPVRAALSRPHTASTPTPDPPPADTPDPARAAAKAEAAVERLRALAAHQPEQENPRLARALIAWSDRLAEQGLAEQGLAVADDAVDLAESLREEGGDAYDQLYATALYTLGERLRDSGQHAAAADVVGEAVAVRRLTPQADPQRRIAVLGPLLTDYTQFLTRAERPAEAAEAAAEAIELFRDADGEFNRQRAYALHRLSRAQRMLGAYQEALDSARRAVNLARREPDGTTLVDCLRSLAWSLAMLDRPDESLAAAREAVDVARHAHTNRSAALSLAEDDLATLRERFPRAEAAER